jgi:hypothetical protein
MSKYISILLSTPCSAVSILIPNTINTTFQSTVHVHVHFMSNNPKEKQRRWQVSILDSSEPLEWTWLVAVYWLVVVVFFVVSHYLVT